MTPLGPTPVEAAAVIPTMPQAQSAVPTANPIQQVGFVDDPALGESPSPAVPPAPRQTQPVPPGGVARPTRLPPVENPFDPEIFNRLYRQPTGGR